MYIRRWNKSIANLIALLYITVHCCIRHCCIMLWVRCGMNTSHITTKKQHKAYQNQFTLNKYHYELNHCHVKCSIDVITWCSFSWDDARDCNNNKIQTFYMLAMIQIYTTKHHTHSARLCHQCSQKLLDLFPFIITKARMVFYRTQEAVNHTKNNT